MVLCVYASECQLQTQVSDPVAGVRPVISHLAWVLGTTLRSSV